MTLDIMIDEQLLAINAELRAENEKLKKKIDCFTQDLMNAECTRYKLINENDDLKTELENLKETIQFVEKQRDINYKSECQIRHDYDVLLDKYNLLKREYDVLSNRYHNCKLHINSIYGNAVYITESLKVIGDD